MKNFLIKFKNWLIVIVFGATAFASVTLLPEPITIEQGTVGDTATTTDERLVSLSELQNDSAIESKIQYTVNEIIISQDKHLKQYDKYWQGIKTKIADDKKPKYQKESWKDLEFIFEYPFSVEVHQYETPTNEHGFIIYFDISYDGYIFKRIYDKQLGLWN